MTIEQKSMERLIFEMVGDINNFLTNTAIFK